MWSATAIFEARYQLRSPLFVVAFALFFLLAFGSVTSENIRIGAGGNVHVNAPFAIAQTIAVLNLFGLFVVTAFVANVIIRDDETGFQQHEDDDQRPAHYAMKLEIIDQIGKSTEHEQQQPDFEINPNRVLLCSCFCRCSTDGCCV